MKRLILTAFFLFGIANCGYAQSFFADGRWITVPLDLTGTLDMTGGVTINNDTTAGQLIIDGTLGGCTMYRDTDDAGWTECFTLDGTLTCTVDSDGFCDGS